LHAQPAHRGCSSTAVNPAMAALRQRVLVGGAAALGLGLYAVCRHRPSASDAGDAGDASSSAAAGEAESEPARYINDVMNDNAEFDAHARAQGFVPVQQAEALLTIFDDAAIRSVVQQKLGPRFDGCAAKLEPWRAQAPADLGAAIERVVTDLAADHLRPDGMLQRLRDGVDAASFGVATLLTNMALPAAP
jgi:hypothetical protein